MSVSKSVTTQPGRNGGTLNVGGDHVRTGRPPSAIRMRLREILDNGTEVIEGFVQGRVPLKLIGVCDKCGHEHPGELLTKEDLLLLSLPKGSDRLKALELAGRFGIEDKVDESFVLEVVAEVTAVLKPEPNGDELLRQIFERLKPVIAKRL